ncbi:phosphate ABC transporter substrate-binding protein PstS [Armatimonas sp.]|uniref:phosphate ABC transporter substrate-binding protein PstS n=1 Tax=Armatimonas sp. TaxID=1872638 RepID=UPI0037526B96
MRNFKFSLTLLPLALAATAQAQVSGAGATFPELLYNNWAKEYKASGGVAVNYQGIGSGGGIKAITAKTVDFGASDSPMNAEERQGAPKILHLPMCAGAVVVAYNAPGVPNGLKLTGAVIADIFLHKIITWNDGRIAGLNPSIKLPASRIVTVSRSDSSGTTAIFTNYLAKVSPVFKTGIGEGKSVNWTKGGLAGKGNPGVAAFIKQTPGAIGYIELAFADKNAITYAHVQNLQKNFSAPTLASTSAAVAGVKLPADFCAMATNTSDPNGYPITGFTWILLYPDAKPEVKRFLHWCLTTGQKSAAKYDYAPLPAGVQSRVLNALKKIGG